MARPLRIERVGWWFHVTARGNDRREVYRDDRDRRHFLELVGKMVKRFRLRVHTFVLMETHAVVAMCLRRYAARLRADAKERVQLGHGSRIVKCYGLTPKAQFDDAANRMTNVTSPAGAFGYQYDPGVMSGVTSAAGLVRQLTLPGGGTVTNHFDEHARWLATELGSTPNI